MRTTQWGYLCAHRIGKESFGIDVESARPIPDFGRPVHLIDYSPELLRKLFGFALTSDTRPTRHYPRVWI